MGRIPAIAAVAAALVLAGCSSEPQSPVDPEKAEPSDYVVPSIAFVVAAITGLVLLGAGLALQRRRRRKRAQGPDAPVGGQAKGR